MTRRGLTLIELLVTLVVFGILGTALMRLTVSSSDFVSRQEAMLEARRTARAAMHLMTAELRMVTDGGIRTATPDSVVARLPFVFGVLCRNQTAVLMPTDSVVFASALMRGVAYRQPDGAYGFASGVTMILGGTEADCTVDSIRVVPGGQYVTLSATVAPSGTVFYAFHRVSYFFAPSDELPGRIGLWRGRGLALAEEVLAPFAAGAGFAFLTGTRLTVETAPPPLDSIQGLELRLIAESERPPSGAAAPTRYTLAPRIKFMNQAIQ